jgi:sugar/nucleoside kinase (ribokinase family)
MPLEEVVDPTGAGDSFAGGFFGYLASQPELTPAAYRRAMFYGSVMGSFTVRALWHGTAAEALPRGDRRAIQSIPRVDAP